MITGGSGGIGSEISRKFIDEGYDVYSIDLQTIELGAHFHNETVDVTDIEQLLEIKKRLDGIRFDHIITLAGRALEGEWVDFPYISVDVIGKSINLNITGHLNIINIFYDTLSDNFNRSFVTISSINAFGGFGLPVYSSAKAGLIGFTKAVYSQMAQDGIRINTVCPGTVVTEATKLEPKDFELLLKFTNSGRFVTAKEVAYAVYSLCEIKTDCNGEILILDEGQLENSHAKCAQ